MIVYKNNPIPEIKKRDSLDFSNYMEVLEANISVHKKICSLDKLGYSNTEIYEMLNEKGLLSSKMKPSHITSILKSKKQKND
jgi:hypothetical protein